MIQEHVAKLMRGIDIGLGCSVVTGTKQNLKSVKDSLKIKLADDNIFVTDIELDSNDIALNLSERANDFIILTGLEALSPKDNLTYAIRSFLDRAKHENLMFIIFCETSYYAAHFNDYNAPFYQFCPQFPVIEA